VHSFKVEYPGRLNNCEGCHNPDTYYPVDPATVLGTTADVNVPEDVTDDVVISPNTSVCSTCHTDVLAIQHMQQNGGDFDARKAADSSLVSASVETCVVCHGKGRTADVKEMHDIGAFEFN
jgi:OmcA/MtrC family decaheme c-type cytochrome